MSFADASSLCAGDAGFGVCGLADDGDVVEQGAHPLDPASV
jgi:hypothetical protein